MDTPRNGWVKINIDATIKKSLVALVCICYNHEGVPLWTPSENIPNMSLILNRVYGNLDGDMRGKDLKFRTRDFLKLLDLFYIKYHR